MILRTKKGKSRRQPSRLAGAEEQVGEIWCRKVQNLIHVFTNSDGATVTMLNSGVRI
jgi:hypothetical protein